MNTWNKHKCHIYVMFFSWFPVLPPFVLICHYLLAPKWRISHWLFIGMNSDIHIPVAHENTFMCFYFCQISTNALTFAAHGYWLTWMPRISKVETNFYQILEVQSCLVPSSSHTFYFPLTVRMRRLSHCLIRVGTGIKWATVTTPKPITIKAWHLIS